MANFLDYLNGGEPEKDKETIEDVGAKDLLNRIPQSRIDRVITLVFLSDAKDPVRSRIRQILYGLRKIGQIRTDQKVVEKSLKTGPSADPGRCITRDPKAKST